MFGRTKPTLFERMNTTCTIYSYTGILTLLTFQRKTNFLGKNIYISTIYCPHLSTWTTKLLKNFKTVMLTGDLHTTCYNILLPSFSLGFKALSSFFCFASSSSRFSCRASFRSSSLQSKKYLQDFNLLGM